MDGNSLKQKVNSIGYNKEELLEVKTILENSIKVRKSEKTKFEEGWILVTKKGLELNKILLIKSRR
ncbi:hypothetical protein Q7506_11580 [Glaesserella parasuis]|nr:hypothetical protein [Glaesserella parasuis]